MLGNVARKTWPQQSVKNSAMLSWSPPRSPDHRLTD